MVALIVFCCIIVAAVWVLWRQRRQRRDQAIEQLSHGNSVGGAGEYPYAAARLSPVPSTLGVVCQADQTDRHALIVRLTILLAGNGLDNRQASLRHNGRFSTRGEAQFTIWHGSGACVIVRTTKHQKHDENALRFVVYSGAGVPRVMCVGMPSELALSLMQKAVTDGMSEATLAQLQSLVGELSGAYLIEHMCN